MSTDLNPRWLQPGDEALLGVYLAKHLDSTVIMASNLHQVGLEHTGEPYQGQYAAIFEAGDIVGVAARYWNGNVVVSCPVEHVEAVVSMIGTLGEPTAGLLGVSDQVVAAAGVLGLEETPTAINHVEDLMALNLDVLQVPELLSDDKVSYRRASRADMTVLLPWRVAYMMEVMAVQASPALETACKDSLLSGIEESRLWVLVRKKKLVAMSGFNASLPGLVQVGGVWTPKAMRGRGFARAVVAGSLMDAREAGAVRSMLFTNNPAAVKAYLSLGFEWVGSYGLVVFE